MPRWFNAVATTGTGSELLHLSSWKRYTKYQVFLTFCYNFIKIKAFAHPSPSSPVKKSKKKRKICRALFSWNILFEIRPFALIPTILDVWKYSQYAPENHLIKIILKYHTKKTPSRHLTLSWWRSVSYRNQPKCSAN